MASSTSDPDKLGRDIAAYVNGSEPTSEADGSQSDAQRELAAERIEKYKPSTGKRVAAWAAVAVGVLTLISPAFAFVSLADTVGGTLVSAAILIPGGYWLYRDGQDRGRITEWAEANERYERAYRHLNAAERQLFAEPSAELPLLPKRYWPIVWVIVAALVLIGGTVMDAGAGA